jgi:hypothetical protein
MRASLARGDGLALVSGGAAALGGTLWSIKSLGILIADAEPEYAFAVAPFWFGLACIGLVRLWEDQRDDRSWQVRATALLACGAGGVAATAYVVQGDAGVFSVSVLVAMLAVLAVLLGVGRRIWRAGVFERSSFFPWALAWLMLASIPIGGALAALDERLLEVPLLAVGLAWIWLGRLLGENSSRKQRRDA